MNMIPNAKKPWLNELDRGKGLAILLVVIGHVVARDPPNGASWYLMLKFTVYLFHMPFFVFLSGVAMSYTYRGVESFTDYLAYIKNKFFRFIPIFFLFGILILVGKDLAERFLQVDNTSTSFLTGMKNLILYPGLSPASTLWYIYVLFMYYLIFPLFASIKNSVGIALIVICSLVLSFYAYTVTNLFLLERFSEYLCFAVFGWLAGKYYEVFMMKINRFGWLSIGLFISAIVFFDLLFSKCIIYGDCSYFPHFFNTIHAIILCGLLSIPALMYLLKFKVLSKCMWLEKIGKYVFVIYLFNTIVIGVVKGVGLKFVSWDNENFLVYFPVLFLSGVFIPILLKKHLFPSIPILDRATW